jgi:hypothetical protein
MGDPPVDSNGDTRVRPARGSPPGLPRWVKTFGLIAAIVLVVLFVTQHLGGMGSHH